jgi:hypothetical protein
MCWCYENSCLCCSCYIYLSPIFLLSVLSPPSSQLITSSSPQTYDLLKRNRCAWIKVAELESYVSDPVRLILEMNEVRSMLNSDKLIIHFCLSKFVCACVCLCVRVHSPCTINTLYSTSRVPLAVALTQMLRYEYIHMMISRYTYRLNTE